MSNTHILFVLFSQHLNNLRTSWRTQMSWRSTPTSSSTWRTSKEHPKNVPRPVSSFPPSDYRWCIDVFVWQMKCFNVNDVVIIAQILSPPCLWSRAKYNTSITPIITSITSTRLFPPELEVSQCEAGHHGTLNWNLLIKNINHTLPAHQTSPKYV